jgi:hypothetical protein
MDKEDKQFIRRIIGWSILVVIIMALLSFAGWGATVALSNWRGAGNAIIQKNGADNRIAAQQNFEDLITDIKASDAKLDQAASDAKTHPNDSTYATNFTGLTNHCLDSVGIYNADARKYTAAQFRASDLPAQIDQTDPATDCKVNK